GRAGRKGLGCRERRERGERRETRFALSRSAHRGQLHALVEREIRAEAFVADDRAVQHREQRSDAELLLPELQAQRLLGELERSLRRREEELVAAAAGPKRPADAAGEDQLRPLLVEPRRRHRALELLERLRRAAAGALGEGEE